MIQLAISLFKSLNNTIRYYTSARTLNPEKKKYFLYVEATGNQSPDARGCEVHILEYLHGPDMDDVFDLSSTSLSGSWRIEDGVNCGPIALNTVLKSDKGTIRLPFSEAARLTFLSHPWSGFVSLSYRGEALSIDLYNEQTSEVSYLVHRDLMSKKLVIRPCITKSNQPLQPDYGTIRQPENQSYQSAHSNDKPNPSISFSFHHHSEASNPYHACTSNALSVITPRWKGVAQSTQLFFCNRLFIPSSDLHTPEQVDDDLIDQAVAKIISLPYSDVVFSGGDLFQIKIARRLKGSKKCHLLWHSNFLQTGETHDWAVFRQWLHAQREGIISRIAVVRQGYHQYLQTLGFEALFIPNQIPITHNVSIENSNNDTIGIWLSGSSNYRKSADIMITAVCSLSNLKVKISGCQSREYNLLRYNLADVPFVSSHPLPFEELQSEMASVALNLYVTASESSPMLPLESFALGVPCIIGANSHLFKDDEFLSKHLRVCNVGSSREIADKISLCLNSKSAILQQYSLYAERQVRIALSGLEKLLNA
jgi:hypothetical protein